MEEVSKEKKIHGCPIKDALQVSIAEEQRQLKRLTKAGSERLDVVRRAKALLSPEVDLRPSHTIGRGSEELSHEPHQRRDLVIFESQGRWLHCRCDGGLSL